MQIEKKNWKYIHIAIYLIITFGVGFLSPFAQITELGMKVLGVFLGTIYAWLFISLSWPSLFALVALGVVGYGSGVNALFIEGISFQIIPQLILCFIFAEAVAMTQFTDYLANKVMSLKIFAGKPFLLMAGLILCVIIMNILQCGLAGLFLLWVICKEIAKKAGYEERNQFCTIMVTSTLVVYVFSAMILPYSPGPLMQIAFFNQGMPDVTVPFFSWLVYWLLYCVVYTVIWTVVVKFIVRPDFSAIAALGSNLTDLGKEKMSMNREQKFGLSMLLLLTVGMILPSFFPSEWAITVLLSNLGLTGILAIILCLMCIYQKKDGKPFMTMQTAAKGITWDVIWLLMAISPLASAINSADCGIMASILAKAMPFLMNMSPMLFLAVCAIVLGAVTQVCNNMVLMAVFIPLLCPMYAQMGGNPLSMFIILALSTNAAFATPAASWSAALMFGDSSIIRNKTYLYGLIHFICSILLALLSLPFMNMLFS